jgi:hypothetical protein
MAVTVNPGFVDPKNGFPLLRSPFKMLFCPLYTSESILFGNRRLTTDDTAVISSFSKGSPNSIIAIL